MIRFILFLCNINVAVAGNSYKQYFFNSNLLGFLYFSTSLLCTWGHFFCKGLLWFIFSFRIQLWFGRNFLSIRKLWTRVHHIIPVCFQHPVFSFTRHESFDACLAAENGRYRLPVSILFDCFKTGIFKGEQYIMWHSSKIILHCKLDLLSK